MNKMKFFEKTNLKSLIPALPALLVCIFSMHLFIELTDEMMEKDLIKLDALILDLAINNRSEEATEFFTIITWFGDRYVYIIVSILFFAAFYFSKGSKRETLLLGIVSISGFLANILLKWYFERPRPAGEQLTEAIFYSYPSGHSMSSVIFYGFLIYVAWHEKLNIIWKILLSLSLTGLILAIGISRMYLGVHYASDVLAGFLGGLFWLFLFILCLRFLKIKTT